MYGLVANDMIRTMYDINWHHIGIMSHLFAKQREQFVKVRNDVDLSEVIPVQASLETGEHGV